MKQGVVYSYPNTMISMSNNIVILSKRTHTLKIVIFWWDQDGLPESLPNLPKLEGCIPPPPDGTLSKEGGGVE